MAFGRQINRIRAWLKGDGDLKGAVAILPGDQRCPFCGHGRCGSCKVHLTMSRDWVDCCQCGDGAQARYWMKKNRGQQTFV